MSQIIIFELDRNELKEEMSNDNQHFHFNRNHFIEEKTC